MLNYQSTQFPEMFKKTYWGNHHNYDSSICQNRDQFVHEYLIKDFNTYHSHKAKTIINSYISYKINSSDRDFFDHFEVYQTIDNEYIIRVRPFNHVQDCELYMHRLGFTQIDPLYARHANTFIKFVDFNQLQDDIKNMR